MLLALFRAINFWWAATRGNRLTPWRSEYLRWRVETYSGIPAKSLRISDFWRLMVKERGQLIRFMLWSSEMQTLAEAKSD